MLWRNSSNEMLTCKGYYRAGWCFTSEQFFFRASLLLHYHLISFLLWLVFGQRQRKDVSWLREHIGKTLLNVHLVLCYFTVWLGKVFVEPEWNPDSLVLIAMIGNCQKEIGVIQAALLKFNMMLNFTWAHTENALLPKDFVLVSTTWFRLIPQGIFKIYQNINTDRF